MEQCEHANNILCVFRLRLRTQTAGKIIFLLAR